MIITAWRIVQERHSATAFNEEGAAQYPGRWNERGVPMVYTAGSLSLAALEILVHIGNAGLSRRYVSIPVSFDSTLCRQLTPSDLPQDWATDPAPESTRVLGVQWIEAASSVVLALPSAIVPLESIFLINPRHKDVSGISIGEPGEFRFDSRLFQ